jgi:hypothetical protein
MAKVQLAFRFEQAVLARVDAVGEALARDSGLEVTRSDATRRIVLAGLEVLEGKFGIAPVGQVSKRSAGSPRAGKTSPKRGKR